jgi:Arc/MetJ-type ribon-helix-helix transcriptional regulator
MNVLLKPEIQHFIDEQVKTGRFDSPQEVLEEALVRMMDELVEFDEPTLDAIDESEDQIQRGQFRDWKQVSAELRAKYLRK